MSVTITDSVRILSATVELPPPFTGARRAGTAASRPPLYFEQLHRIATVRRRCFPDALTLGGGEARALRHTSITRGSSNGGKPAAIAPCHLGSIPITRCSCWRCWFPCRVLAACSRLSRHSRWRTDLFAGTLGWLSVAARPVGAIIALSIAFVAGESSAEFDHHCARCLSPFGRGDEHV